jgi:hypothetical protein
MLGPPLVGPQRTPNRRNVNVEDPIGRLILIPMIDYDKPD